MTKFCGHCTVMTTLRSPRGDLAEAQFMARSGGWQHGEVRMVSLGPSLHGGRCEATLRLVPRSPVPCAGVGLASP